MNPRQKAIRTALQIAAGVLVLAVPLIVGLGLSAAVAAQVGALITFAGGVIALLQNTLEDAGVLPKILRPADPSTPPSTPSS